MARIYWKSENKLSVKINGAPLDLAQNISYRSHTNYLPVPAGESVKISFHDAVSGELVTEITTQFASDSSYSVFATGLGEYRRQTIISKDDLGIPYEGLTRFRFVNLSTDDRLVEFKMDDKEDYGQPPSQYATLRYAQVSGFIMRHKIDHPDGFETTILAQENITNSVNALASLEIYLYSYKIYTIVLTGTSNPYYSDFDYELKLTGIKNN